MRDDPEQGPHPQAGTEVASTAYAEGWLHRAPGRVQGPRAEPAGPGPSRVHPLEASGMRTAPLASLNGNGKAARQAKAIFSASEEA